MELEKKEECSQSALLKKLEKYGDSLLDQKDYERRTNKNKARKRKLKNTGQLEDDYNSLTDIDTVTAAKKKRKKKKKKAKDKHDIDPDLVNAVEISVKRENSDLKGAKRHLHELKKVLDLVEYSGSAPSEKKDLLVKPKQSQSCAVSKHHVSSKDVVNTSGKVKVKAEPEVIVFTDKRKQSKEVQKQHSLDLDEEQSTLSESQHPAFQLEKARHEVRTLGIKGFEGTKKDVAMVAYLIKLGAKPPKKKYVNYKEFQERRKQEIQKNKEKVELDRSQGLKVKSNRKDKTSRKRDKNDVVGLVDGQVGRYKDGVQFIKRDELKGLKKSKPNKR